MNYQTKTSKLAQYHKARKKGTYSCPCLSADEDVVGKKSEEEGNVCLNGKLTSVGKAERGEGIPYLYTPDTELNESPQHLSTGNFVSCAAYCHLDQQTIIVGLHDFAYQFLPQETQRSEQGSQ